MTDHAISPEVALHQSAFDRWQAFSESAAGRAAMFAWAAAEALIWPIIPDALLMPMAAATRHTYWRLLASAALGSALGGALMLLISNLAPDLVMGILTQLPFVRSVKLINAAAALDHQGVYAFLSQPWSGVAFKLYAPLSAVRDLNPLSIIPLSVAARTLRLFITSAVVAVLARRFPNVLRDDWLYFILAYILLFAYGWWQICMAHP